MKKFTDFLEKNCQWLAIGLGGLYLFWMIWSYIPGGAWSVPVGGEPKTPGDVDQAVATIAQQLKDRIEHTPAISFKVPTLSLDPHFIRIPSPATIVWANSQTQDVGLPGVGPIGPANGNPQVPAGIVFVTELPHIPAATDLAVVGGRSNMSIPATMPIVAPDASGAAVPAPAPAAPAVAAAGTDGSWQTVAFKISIADLAREFNRVNIPAQNFNKTVFLDVDLIRQEKQAGDNWGGEVVCQKLTTSTQPPFPLPAAPQAAMQEYLNWAISKTQEILQPTFYAVLKGDPWTLPKEFGGLGGDAAVQLPPNPDGTRAGFDPSQYITFTPAQLSAINPPLNNVEKQAIYKAKQDAAAKAAREKAKSRPAPSTPTPSGPKGGARFSQSYIPRDEGFGPGAPPAPGAFPPAVAPPQPGAVNSKFPTPSGEFDPRVFIAAPPQNGVNPNVITCWAHDCKPEEGKTYRYKVRYRIKNPLWLSLNRTNPKQLADTFALTSADSDWSNEIHVKSSLEFFFASSGLGPGSKARVDVYKWQSGQTNREKFFVAAGDVIGGEKNGTDYATGYVLVDLRPDFKNESVVAWLLTPDGSLIQREVRGDAENPRRAELDREVNAATLPPTGTGGTAPPAPGTQPPPTGPRRPAGPRL